MTLESGLDNLADLKALLNVYEQLGAEDEPHLEDLMNVYRSVHGEFEMLLREAPFSSSPTDEAKVFLLSDAVLIGLDTRAASKSNRGKRSGTLDKKKKKGTLEIKKGTLTRFKGAYKLLHYLDLRNCTLRDAGTNAEGFCGLQLTHVHRIRVEPARGRNGKKQGTARIMTKVAKLEMWLPTEELKQQLHQSFVEALADLERLDLEEGLGEDSASESGALARRASGVSTGSGGSASGQGKQRKWAANRARRTTLDKQLSHVSGADTASARGSLAPSEAPAAGGRRGTGRASSGGGSGGGSQAGDSVGGGLQLADLEQRYKVILADVSTDDKTDFEVEFDEGRMGLSLGSASGLGVIVGDIAPGGFAEAAGVLISDRVTAINGVEVGLDDHWQDVLERLKQLPRPLTIRFERFAARTGNLMRQNKALAKVKGPATDGAETAGMSGAKARELHKILQKAHRVVARGGELLPLLTALPSAPGVSEDSNRRSAAAVLEEIFRTELTYVRDLRNLVEVYVLPLRNHRVQTRCRDMEGAGIMCEHGLRATCRQMAKEPQPLVRGEDLKGIFLNAETLMFVNVELLRLLENRLAGLSDSGKRPLALDDTVKGFSEAFTQVMPFFKLYSEFCHQYATAVDRLLLLRNGDQAVNDFIKDIERAQAKQADADRRVQTLSSLLIKPVQRICKYPLLFRELLKHTAPSVPGRRALEAAAMEVQRIADAVNNRVGESDQFELFMDVYRGLGGEAVVPDLVTPSRRYVDTALVTVKEAPFSGAGSPQPRTLFIFNDLLILARAEGGGTLRAGGRPQSLTKRLSLGRRDSHSTQGGASAIGDGGGGGLGRVVSRFFAGVSALLGGDADGGDAAGGRDSRRKTLKRGRNYKLLHQWDLALCKLKDKVSEGDTHTLVLIAKERVMEDVGPSGTGKGAKNGSQHSGGGTGKVRTEVSRYLLGFDSKESLEATEAKLLRLQQELRSRADEFKRSKSTFGNKADYSKRGWRQKSLGPLRVGVAPSTDEADDDE